MKGLRLTAATLTVALAATVAPVLGQTLYVSPDVPADPDAAFLLPWEIVRHDPGAAAPYTTVLGIPGDPAAGALHRMDRAGNWLFSVEAPSDLGGALGGAFAEPRDVVRYNAGAYTRFFCGGLLPATDRIPVTSNIDALYQEGGDDGALILSFDVPTTVGGAGGPTFQPSALVRFRRTGAGCGGFSLVGLEADFATLGTFFPGHSNLTGADRVGGGVFLLALEIPTDLAPLSSGPPTFTPGLIAFYDPATGQYGLFSDLQVSGVPGWSIAKQVDGLSCSGNPGKLDPASAQITLDKVGAGDVLIGWSPGSCSAGAENYGIYEGELSVLRTGVYDYVQIDCDDAGSDLQEQITPAAADTYYVVVPYTTCGDEGSYGTDLVGGVSTERPTAASGSRCADTQTLSACP